MNKGNSTFGGGLSAVVLVLLAAGGMNSAKADTLLCANQALQGGGNYGGGTDTVTPFAGQQDMACGTDSGETLSISKDTDYSKLEWNTSAAPQGVSTEPLPSGLTLGGFLGANALVTFTADQADSPYFLLAFTDTTDSLGQADAGDQILLIEDEDNSSLNGAGQTTLAIDPTTSLFDLYDNTTGNYLSADSVSQADPTTIDALLGDDPGLSSDTIHGVWLAVGLAGGCGTGPCSETLAVDSANLVTPEPGSIALLFAGVCAAGLLRRRQKA
jgi:hypothetical protein